LTNKAEKNIFDIIWGFFASLKLAIVLILLLAVTSIIGTIIEQNVEPAKNIQLLARMFGDNAAPTIYNIFVKLDFMDMYHSWWFVALLVLFCINLSVCSLEKLPRTWRLISTPMKPMAENVLKTLPVKRELSLKRGLAVVKDEFLNTLSESKYRVLEATEDNGIQLYSQKGGYTRLGVYVVHLSILLIFLGAIVGARFGYDAFINLPEGRASEVVYSNSGEGIPLGFTIHCNWYNTDYYKGIDTPQEFQSELVIVDGGREVLKKIIEVNNPLTYKGITFYQSSYGMIPDAIGEFRLRVSPDGLNARTLRLHLGESFEIPEDNIKGTIVDFSPALGRDPQTGALTTYSETMVNPAVKIQFEIKGTEEDVFTGWILKRYPDTGVLRGGQKIEFLDYWGVEYTGLQVSKDPGVPIIYFACIIMALGLYIAFFMSHKKLWVLITTESSGKKNNVKVTVGASANKNRLGFEKEIEDILSKALLAIEERGPAKK
jgi:cytochrome c biogenesis protein